MTKKFNCLKPTADIKLFAGTSNLPLAQEIAALLGVGLAPVTIKKFKDGEIYVRIDECIRNRDVFILQSLSAPVNENLMELLIMLDAFKRASAKSITVVMPYMGYARQDRKTSGREAITAKLVADLITTAGATKVVTLDLHASQIQGFFNIGVDQLRAMPIFVDYVKSLQIDTDKLVVVSPDMGGIGRARKFAQALKCPIGVIDKHRTSHNEAVANFIIGDVTGKVCFVCDDMIDTGGTICEAVRLLKENGAADIYVFATHGVFSGNAIERLSQAPIQKCIVTNSIDSDKLMLPIIDCLSVAPLLAKAIQTIDCGDSMSALLERMQNF